MQFKPTIISRYYSNENNNNNKKEIKKERGNKMAQFWRVIDVQMSYGQKQAINGAESTKNGVN